MKLLLLYTALTCLTVTNCFGQLLYTDSTKPSSFIPYCNDRDDKLDSPVRPEWVQIDKDNIQNKINKLPAIGSSISEIQKLIPHFLDGKCNCRSTTEDLGYGLKSTQHTIHGGYGSCNIDAIYFGDRVIKLRLTINNRREIIESTCLILSGCRLNV